MWRKPHVFICFLRFGRKHCAQFGAPEAHFRRFLSLGTGPKIWILNLPMLFFNPSLARHSSKMSLLGHASEAMHRHFPRPAWFEILILRLPKLIWTFPMADPEAHFGHFPGPGSKMMAFWCVLVLNVYLRHFSALSLARKRTLWDSWSSFFVSFKYVLIIIWLLSNWTRVQHFPGLGSSIFYRVPKHVR